MAGEQEEEEEEEKGAEPSGGRTRGEGVSLRGPAGQWPGLDVKLKIYWKADYFSPLIDLTFGLKK